MKFLLLNLFLFFIFFFWGCKQKDHINNFKTKNEKLADYSNNKINKDIHESKGKFIKMNFDSIKQKRDSNQLTLNSEFQQKTVFYKGINYFHKLNISTKTDSIKYILKNYNEYYYSNYTPLMYRFNKRGNLYIEYNAITHDNILFDSNLKKIGTINIEANNPEFSIETIPLEDEPGILFFDGIYGFEKFELVNNYLQSKFKKKINNTTVNKPYIIKDQNKLIILEKNYQKKVAHLNSYSLINGIMLSSKKIDYFLESKYFIEGNLLVLFLKNKVNILDLNSNKEFNIFLSTNPESFVIKKKNNKIFGFCKSNNSIINFKEQNKILETSNFIFINKYHLIDPVIIKDFLAYSYFETEKVNDISYSNRIGQGIILFKSDSTYIFEFPLNEMLLKVNNFDDNEIIIGNSFFIYFDTLKKLL